MKKVLLTIVFFVSIFHIGWSQKVDTKLEKKLKPLLDSFHGVSAIYVENIKTGKIVAINADTIFPTASIVKVPILTAVYSQINAGKLQYNQPLIYKDSLKYGGSGLMQFFKDSSKTDLSTAAALMIDYSDNTTSLWLQLLVGGSDKVNDVMESIGLHNTRDNSRTNREAFRSIYGWGQTTPREMATLLKLIFQKKILTPSSCESMYRTMSHVYYDNFSLSQIPPYVQTASKQGMVDDSRSELVLVNAPHGDYVFYIATKKNKDQRWTVDNEAWELQRKISSILWNYFEPKSHWAPSSGFEKYLEK
ncbi:MAG: serine hydrolase [Pseudopedobacter saltans]|uniref:Serine hydrolase n=1 Tax=Pseudopedobacter saltans TaxID=151895 RepID=A0A2W5ETQ7_9SPHI|nr:MAG: serine hydrolase [Pseudopedobacter saltans]